MKIMLYIITAVLTILTGRDAYKLWKQENKRVGGFVVGLIAVSFPILAYWLVTH